MILLDCKFLRVDGSHLPFGSNSLKKLKDRFHSGGEGHHSKILCVAKKELEREDMYFSNRTNPFAGVLNTSFAWRVTWWSHPSV